MRMLRLKNSRPRQISAHFHEHRHENLAPPEVIRPTINFLYYPQIIDSFYFRYQK